jgi:UDP-2-acetamido-3-amino-2,3-dideoxy-glucuronate N-acetyltransferase
LHPTLKPATPQLMTTTPHIAVIGCGYWGKNLVRNMAELGVLAAVADAHAANAAAMSRAHNVPVREVADILADPAITGIVIATPAATHAGLATRALEAGKHVFVEKPLALCFEQGQTLAALAQEKSRVLMVGHVLQYHPAFRTLLNEIRANRIGQLRFIQSRRLSFGKIRNEENALWSLAPHDISMVLAIANQRPIDVSGFNASYVTPGISDVHALHLAFAGNLQASIMVSWLHPEKEQRLTVIGERGALVFDDTRGWEQKLAYYPHEVAQENGFPVAKKAEAEYLPLTQAEPLREECRAFLNAMTGGPVPSDAQEALRVLEVLTRAEQQGCM